MTDARFGEIVAQYERLVYTICYQFTRDHHTAEDLVQETFISAYRHRDACPEDSMKPWLSRIAANKAKDYLKSAYNRRVMTPGEDGLPETKGNGVLFITESQPEDITIGRELLRMVSDDIRALKEPYHQVAVLYFLEEQTVEEISKRLDRPPKTVHTQLFRAKKLLQQKLAPAAEETGKANQRAPARQTEGGGDDGIVS
ncbi:sigma-70 family RNA polymerase sigma factor [Ruminococcaceae bacterium OttesenSCG-928-D13]|nr:sigma-70 family RNA polymerase sigma factor [Ruminococcaceae bacterium OttesenSCG-928-D13]